MQSYSEEVVMRVSLMNDRFVLVFLAVNYNVIKIKMPKHTQLLRWVRALSLHVLCVVRLQKQQLPK